jgi:hypothetical protein
VRAVAVLSVIRPHFHSRVSCAFMSVVKTDCNWLSDLPETKVIRGKTIIIKPFLTQKKQLQTMK